MTDREIIRALRCGEDANGTPRPEPSDEEIVCYDPLKLAAADLIERLTAENADLCKEIEWKDMVIALAQKEQAKAEAERDALREKQRWIPVTERLPELEVPVLVLDRRGNMIVRTLRRLVSDKEAVFRPDGLAPRKNITHWMPLAEAPEEGEKE